MSLKERALAEIKRRGTLRWCRGQICACMGCVNATWTRAEYDEAMLIPEVKEAVDAYNEQKKGNLNKLIEWIKSDERKAALTKG